MRLSDLEPRWITGKRSDALEAKGKRGDVGLSFLCPHCREVRLAVPFAPPIDEGILWLWAGWDNQFKGRPIWTRTGETFDTITLTPSIDVSASGHWHGFIQGGDVT